MKNKSREYKLPCFMFIMGYHIRKSTEDPQNVLYTKLDFVVLLACWTETTRASTASSRVRLINAFAFTVHISRTRRIIFIASFFHSGPFSVRRTSPNSKNNNNSHSNRHYFSRENTHRFVGAVC